MEYYELQRKLIVDYMNEIYSPNSIEINNWEEKFTSIIVSFNYVGDTHRDKLEITLFELVSFIYNKKCQ